MPTISLRLTEEEHAALKAWAHDSRRSIQKEAVFRLFDATLSERGVDSIPDKRGDALGSVTPGVPRSESDASESVTITEADVGKIVRQQAVLAEREFKGPDPKPRKK